MGLCQIDKIYILMHPLCYVPPLEQLMEHWQLDSRESCVWFWHREREVRPRQDELIRNLKGNEALVLYPIGSSPEMVALESLVQDTLGRRGVILPGAVDVALKEDWPNMPDDIKGQIADEVRRMTMAYGYAWNAAEFKVIIYSRWMAYRIEQGFKEAELSYDPNTVEVEAFGESFDGCVSHWTGMTASFLGLANPVIKNYELSVPDLGLLARASFVEHVVLDDHVVLYLWQDHDGTPIGLFSKGSHRAWEPVRYARFAADGWHVTVRTKVNHEVWPSLARETKSVHIDGGVVTVQVHAGSRRDNPAGHDALCVLGHGVDMQEFRQALVNAELTTE